MLGLLLEFEKWLIYSAFTLLRADQVTTSTCPRNRRVAAAINKLLS